MAARALETSGIMQQFAIALQLSQIPELALSGLEVVRGLYTCAASPTCNTGSADAQRAQPKIVRIARFVAAPVQRMTSECSVGISQNAAQDATSTAISEMVDMAIGMSVSTPARTFQRRGGATASSITASSVSAFTAASFAELRTILRAKEGARGSGNGSNLRPPTMRMLASVRWQLHQDTPQRESPCTRPELIVDLYALAFRLRDFGRFDAAMVGITVFRAAHTISHAPRSFRGHSVSVPV